MTTTYYKAVRPDGTSFYDESFAWATEPGGITKHPAPLRGFGPEGYLSVATVPTDCTGMRWPCKLLAVEPVGRVWPATRDLPNKRCGGAFRTIEVLDPHLALGPQGVQIAALIERAKTLTPAEVQDLCATWAPTWAPTRYAALAAARDAAWCATRGATWDTTRAATWAAARAVARYYSWDATGAAADAAVGLVVRDLIGHHGFTQEHYDTLTMPWRTMIGPIHPDDEAIASQGVSS